MKNTKGNANLLNFIKKNIISILAILISIALSNVTLQFLLRFLLTNWVRVILISILVILASYPIIRASIRKLCEYKDNLGRQFNLIVMVISLFTAGLFYVAFPVKITGNLLLLNHAPLFLYRLSRLINILSFILSLAYVLWIILSGIAQKMGYQKFWAYAGMLFFIILLLIGLFTYQDYGISSDEPNERTSGLVSAQYFADFIEEKLPDMDPYLPKLSTYRYRYYGVAYQFPLAIIEQNTMLKDQSIWQFRHLANFIFFYCGVLAFFHLASDLFQNGRLGLLGSALLVISPRIFSHAFFNPKDSIFLAVFTIALYFCVQFWQHPSWKLGVLTGIACAYAANVRVIAIALVLITLGLCLIDLFHKLKTAPWKPIILLIVTFFLFFILFWPASWQNPLEYLSHTIQLFSDYTYWHYRIMYLGNYIRGSAVPWHYLPVWMGITIPITYNVLFLVGLIVIIRDSIRSKFRLFTQNDYRIKWIIIGLFFIPPILVIFLRSTLYNGWRHFQFIYTPFLLIALEGIRALINEINPQGKFIPKNIVLSLVFITLGINMLITATWMIQNHPYQYVYFNKIGELVGREKFERDYWRVSMLQGLEYLLTIDQSESITLCTEDQFRDQTFLMLLPEESISSIHIVVEESDFSACDYAIDTYRHPGMTFCGQEMHAISVDGLPILTIFDCQNQRQ